LLRETLTETDRERRGRERGKGTTEGECDDRKKMRKGDGRLRPREWKRNSLQLCECWFVSPLSCCHLIQLL
jgi:hypothetical protein